MKERIWLKDNEHALSKREAAAEILKGCGLGRI